MENELPKWSLQILSRTLFDKIYILFFDFYIENQKLHFIIKICEIQNKRGNAKSFAQLKYTNFFPFWDIWKQTNLLIM